MQQSELVTKLIRAFELSNVKKTFPWVRHIRAGIILVVDSHVLLVREKTNAFIGPPKGLLKDGDSSALITAIRELQEETNVKLGFNADLQLNLQLNLQQSTHQSIQLNPQQNPCILGSQIFCCCREKFGELNVYFTVVATHRPQVTIDQTEICEYEWFDMRKGMKTKKDCSEPTSLLFGAIDNTLLHKKLS